MADLQNGGRQFEAETITKFKGIDVNIRDGTPGYVNPANEAYGLNEAMSPDMSNFNVDRDANLVKRRGLVLVADLSADFITAPTTNMRIIGIQRIINAGYAYLHVTDGLRVVRVRTDGAEKLRVGWTAGSPVPGGDVPSTMEHVNFSGSIWPAYSCIAMRAGAGSAVQAQGGIFTFYGNSAEAGYYAPNSPVGTNLIFFKRRFWAINSQGGTSNNDENRLWFSQPDDPANWGGAGLVNNLVFDRGGGDYLVAIIPYNDQLMVFMTRKTYVVTAEGDPTGWQFRLVSDRVGCIGRKTVKAINGFLYFLSHDGVYKSDGTTFELISGPVNDLLDRSRDFVQPIVTTDLMASYWDNKYILWAKNPAMEFPAGVSCALVYDIELETWTRWDFPGYSFLSEVRYPDKFPDTLFLTEWTSKKLWKMGPSVFSDNGVAIKSKWTSKKMSFGVSMYQKRNHLFGMSVRDDSAGAAGGNYTVQIVPDDRAGIVSSTQPPAGLSVANLKFRGAGYGRYFQTSVEHNGTGFARIYDMTWMNEDRSMINKSRPVRDS